MPLHNAAELSMQELSKFFSMPEKAVAKELGICLTSLKKICRQNGINRWPYRKIKSLDKKLRKLDAAMTHAKDDVTMLHAVHYNASGYARWSETAEQASRSGAHSPILYPTDESNAVTPRYSATSPSGSGSLTPSHAPFPHAIVRPGAAKKNESEAHAVRTSRMHVLVNSHGQGRQDTADAAVRGHDNAEAVRMRASEEVKTGPGDENGAPMMPACGSQQELSDEELIAMLADCAAKPASSSSSSPDNFAQVLSERMSAVADELHGLRHSDSEVTSHDEGSGLEPGDHDLMAALASCCGGQSPFESACGDADMSESDGSHVLKIADSAPARQSEQPPSLAQDVCEDNSLCHWLDDDAGSSDLLWQH